MNGEARRGARSVRGVVMRERAARAKRGVKDGNKSLGDLLVWSLTEIRDGLRGRRGKLTIKRYEPRGVHDPSSFSSKRP